MTKSLWEASDRVGSKEIKRIKSIIKANRTMASHRSENKLSENRWLAKKLPESDRKSSKLRVKSVEINGNRIIGNLKIDDRTYPTWTKKHASKNKSAGVCASAIVISKTPNMNWGPIPTK